MDQRQGGIFSLVAVEGREEGRGGLTGIHCRKLCRGEWSTPCVKTACDYWQFSAGQIEIQLLKLLLATM